MTLTPEELGMLVMRVDDPDWDISQQADVWEILPRLANAAIIEGRIYAILDEIEQAYPEDIFPDTTQAERNIIMTEHPGFIDRTSALMGRHLAKLIRRKLTEEPE